MESVSKKRKAITVEEKFAVICRLEAGESNVVVSSEFGLSHSTISTIWKSRDKIKTAVDINKLNNKKIRKSCNEEIDAALLQWFQIQRSRGIPLSGSVLQAKAEEFGRTMGKQDYKCSESWIQRFRNRHNIVSGKKFWGSGRGFY